MDLVKLIALWIVYAQAALGFLCAAAWIGDRLMTRLMDYSSVYQLFVEFCFQRMRDKSPTEAYQRAKAADSSRRKGDRNGPR